MWVNRRHFFIEEKNSQKVGPTGEVASCSMVVLSIQSQFLVLQLVK